LRRFADGVYFIIGERTLFLQTQAPRHVSQLPLFVTHIVFDAVLLDVLVKIAVAKEEVQDFVDVLCLLHELQEGGPLWWLHGFSLFSQAPEL
jgi:hypothetical protein